MARTVKGLRFQKIVDYDDCPYTDHLEQPEFEDRLRDYENGRFVFLGVRAGVTIVMHDDAHDGYTFDHTLQTPGLWGVESDSGDAYIDEVYVEELASLVKDLQAFGVSEDLIADAKANAPYVAGDAAVYYG